MTSKPEDLLPPAKDFMKKLANAEAEEAAKAARQHCCHGHGVQVISSPAEMAS